MAESKLERHPHREALIEEAQGAHFYGISVSELSRDDLLMVVGYFGRQQREERERREQERQLLDGFISRRRARRESKSRMPIVPPL